ncbi:hypothetical protein B0T16DRAFT_5006 [Cercophora newfieldiana]|uniref:Uncharacterized protein n=1 Tax=Cercophora newfieldiana TaxID=92897 RepID=A0AA40CZU0_9PEZI|nr:hypothetical protein B0T16DRAFT_5006 [Cercophora newfieldiana]
MPGRGKAAVICHEGTQRRKGPESARECGAVLGKAIQNYPGQLKGGQPTPKGSDLQATEDTARARRGPNVTPPPYSPAPVVAQVCCQGQKGPWWVRALRVIAEELTAKGPSSVGRNANENRGHSGERAVLCAPAAVKANGRVGKRMCGGSRTTRGSWDQSDEGERVGKALRLGQRPTDRNFHPPPGSGSAGDSAAQRFHQPQHQANGEVTSLVVTDEAVGFPIGPRFRWFPSLPRIGKAKLPERRQLFASAIV